MQECSRPTPVPLPANRRSLRIPPSSTPWWRAGCCSIKPRTPSPIATHIAGVVIARCWGVPIPVVYCEKCGEAKVDAQAMTQVADLFAREGADAWFTRSVQELMGSLVCGKCGGTAFRKEKDILDVWFDSGVSYAAVVEA